MKTKYFFSLLPSLLIAGCVSSTPTPTFDVELAIQQTLSEMSTESENQLVQPSDTEIPTKLFIDTPTLPPTETPTNTPTKLLSYISGCIPSANTQEIGLVTNIVDGETIEVLINSQTFNVKYLGITIPEQDDPGHGGRDFSSSVTEKNRELVEGQIITLVKDLSNNDQNEYLKRYVFVSDVDGLFVNHELIRLGYAIVDESFPEIACKDLLKQAELEARENIFGIWAPTPTLGPTSIPTRVPTQTPAPLPTPESTKVPTNTSEPPTPLPSITPIPQTTVTCWISPSTIPGATNTDLTFYAQFSPPAKGWGFDISFSPQYSGGQRGCIGVSDNNGIASCQGSSGMLPYGTSVTVSFNTSVGKCEATYTSQ